MAHTATRFEFPIVYEDRDEIHTARWKLLGLNTREHDVNNDRGWLWMSTSDSADTVTVTLYKDAAGSNSVASGTADISGIDDAEVLCTLSEANSSGLSGEFYFIDYDDDATLVRICTTLCVDTDLEVLCRMGLLDDFPSDVYDPTYGMARWCAAATEKCLLMASQLFGEQMGGYGAAENRHASGTDRDCPRYSTIAEPRQMTDAAAHLAMSMAHGACYSQARKTTDSEARDYHYKMYKDATSSWKLTFNTDPDSDEDADDSASAASRTIFRV